MSALGSDVTMLVRGSRLLSAAESFASRLIEKALAARGITVITDAQVVAAERPQASDTGLGRIHGGPVTVTCAGRTIEADEILVATGRRPLLTGMGLEVVGLEPDDVLAGRLPDWLYAVGDASGEAQLTHMGKYRARVVRERITALSAGCGPEPVPENVPVPQVVFTAPQRPDRAAGPRPRPGRRHCSGRLQPRPPELPSCTATPTVRSSWSSTGRPVPCWAPPSSVPVRVSSSTPPSSPSLRGVPVHRLHTPCPPTPPPARSGCDSSSLFRARSFVYTSVVERKTMFAKPTPRG